VVARIWAEIQETTAKHKPDIPQQAAGSGFIVSIHPGKTKLPGDYFRLWLFDGMMAAISSRQ